jgi:hypothetical protein
MDNATTGAVVGVYETDEQARFVLSELETAGIEREAISLIGRGEDEAAEAALAAPNSPAATGAARGALIGGGVVAVAAFMLPGVGVFLASGMVGTMMLGAAMGGGLGILAEIGVPAERVPDYEEDLTDGRYVVLVHGEPGLLERAHALMDMTDRESLARY